MKLRDLLGPEQQYVLESERDAYKQGRIDAGKVQTVLIETLRTRIAVLEAENERLRDALVIAAQSEGYQDVLIKHGWDSEIYNPLDHDFTWVREDGRVSPDGSPHWSYEEITELITREVLAAKDGGGK